ncbi:BZ3500_MvSof-1268-A1-R1_Chr10-1g02758 [Microbotryum saponariae]|uniref:BZ3500_MvSof-1268-A1-R1_Chr10-1g02758 protein n=1 Tax=Microbotryum saponariae TaxID=289078 RepID=A0A2X0L912_9BASI|nr:BZ3500_MvSof-1268-A1-R1_Chr10-1g02758 [Microbotryum saponariae]
MCTPGSTKPLVQGPWPMDRYPCSLNYINYHVNGVEALYNERSAAAISAAYSVGV